MKKHIFGFFIALAIFASFAFIYSLFESNHHKCVSEKLFEEHIYKTSGTPRIVQAIAERRTGKLTLAYSDVLSDERKFAAVFIEENGRMRHIGTVSGMGGGTREVEIYDALPAEIRRPGNLFVTSVRDGVSEKFDTARATPVLMEENH